MIPSINQIQTQILTKAAESDSLPATAVLTENEQATFANITSTSKVSFLRLIVYVVAACHWALYKAIYILMGDIEERNARSRVGSKAWYVDTVLAYQHGQHLTELGEYDNTGLTVTEIKERKIIAKTDVTEGFQATQGILRVKSAKLVAEELVPLTTEEIEGLTAYMELKGIAGIPLAVSSVASDFLKVHYKIYFDGKILKTSGERLDGSDQTPVQTALKDYLKNKNTSAFNGKLSIDELNDVIENVSGVTDVFLIGAWSKFGAFAYTDTNAQGTLGPFTEFRQPESGYFKLDELMSIFQFLPR